MSLNNLNYSGETGVISLRAPYAIYFGDVAYLGYAKTGLGLIEWRRDCCLGQIRRPGCTIDGGIPDLAIAEAVAAGVKSLIIGVAPSGGRIPKAWLGDLIEAASAGLDIISGLHHKLSAIPELAAAAERSGARLVDVRTPPPNLPVGNGAKRAGKRLLTVGTDCAVGKKYTALAIERELKRRCVKADFRATGQTGIMIAGSGIPIDAVVADFISGAAEIISPDNQTDHWDVIEGQGALTNPSYAGVSLGLLHGSQPDALVLCHDPTRTHHSGSAKTLELVSIAEAMELNLALARRVNKDACFVGVALNTSRLTDEERKSIIERYTEGTGLPVVDPILSGVCSIVDLLLADENREIALTREAILLP